MTDQDILLLDSIKKKAEDLAECIQSVLWCNNNYEKTFNKDYPLGEEIKEDASRRLVIAEAQYRVISGELKLLFHKANEISLLC